MEQKACDNCGTLFADRSGKCPVCGALRDKRKSFTGEQNLSSNDLPPENVKIKEKESSKKPISSKYITGFIIDFSIKNGYGLISGDDGNRYYFYGNSWNSSENPTEGMRVEFNIRENEALSIYKDFRKNSKTNSPSEPTGSKTKKNNVNTDAIKALYIIGSFFPIVGWIGAFYLLIKGEEMHALGVGALSLFMFFFWIGFFGM